MPSFQKSLIVEQFQGNYLKATNCCFMLSEKPITSSAIAISLEFSSRKTSACLPCTEVVFTSFLNSFFKQAAVHGTQYSSPCTLDQLA